VGRKQGRTGKYLLCFITIIVLFINNCSTITALRTINLSNDIKDAQIAHKQGKYQEAINLYKRVIETGGNKKPVDIALYNLGLIYIDENNPESDTNQSLYYFKRLLTTFPDSQRSQEARLWIDILESLKELKEKNREYRKLKPYFYFHYKGSFEETLKKNVTILNNNPETSPSDLALFNLGLLHVYSDKEQDFNKALTYFKRLIREFPKSPRVDEARAWVKTLEIIIKLSRIEIEMEKKKKQLTE
jgi:outer membrane protein assembly factor BamD (BamD/ComL family)